MPNRIAITWENDRLTLLSANVHNGSVGFERAETFLLQGDSASPALKTQVAEFVQKHRLQKSEVLVVMSRSDVEVRPMLFPPVPVEELPDLVAFQASKEFNGYDAAAPLDFFITSKLESVSRSTLFPAISDARQKNAAPAKAAPAPGAPKHVLASTLRLATLKKIESFCSETVLVLHRILLRPCEAAFVLRQSSVYEPGRSVLLVELDANETSQAVLFQGEPVFMRSPRIACPEDVSTSDFAARLIAELKRTRVAVRNEIQGVALDEVILCGVGKNYESLAKQVAAALEIPVKVFDPWQGLNKARTINLDRPERFAPLIGALLRDAKGEPGEIDFCHPSKRPEPVGKRKLVTGILAASLILLIGLLGAGVYFRMALTEEIKSLSNRLTALQRTAASVSTQRGQLAAIEAWQIDNVDWFAELDWLSRKAPGAQEMILTDLTLQADNAGSMLIKSLLKDASVVAPMEDRLREGNHAIKTGEKRESISNTVSPMYGFLYNLTVSLTPETENAARKSGVPGVPSVEKETPKEVRP